MPQLHFAEAVDINASDIYSRTFARFIKFQIQFVNKIAGFPFVITKWRWSKVYKINKNIFLTIFARTKVSFNTTRDALYSCTKCAENEM